MFNRVAQRAAIAAALGSFCAAATAERVDLFVYESASGGDVSGLDLWVDVIDGGSSVDFVFHNDSTIASVVTSVYFEDVSAASGLSSPSILPGAGVDFAPGATPGDPAGSISGFYRDWAGNLYTAGATQPSPMMGINPGETLTISFDFSGVFSDMLAALRSDTGDFRLAQHVQGVGPLGFSVWTTTVPAPAPLALLALGGLVASRRSR